MVEHPRFKHWRPQGAVSIYGWTEVGYLMPDGKFVPDGKHYYWGGGLHLMGSGDTLYVMPKGAMKVGREFMIC
jgi:hypothetical protein